MIDIKNLKINVFSFNQDNTLLGIGTKTGYLIFNTKNLEKLSDKFININIKKLELYYKTNILYFVGSHSENSLLIHDDCENRIQRTLNMDSSIVKIIARRE